MADMSTLETRLREALEAGTAGAAAGTDLAAGARVRATARRRHRFVGVGVAAVCAAGLGLAAVVADDPPPAEVPPAADAPSADEEGSYPPGWHPVEWRGVRVQVPNTWGSGALSEWCERGPLLGTPVVERPGGARPGSRCTDPALGYGVQFIGRDRSEQLESHDVRSPRPAERALYPQDAWIGITCGGCDVAVRVIAPSPYVARYLLGTYTPSANASGG
jgi:hypothetical protein